VPVYLKQYTDEPNAGDVAGGLIAAHIIGRPVCAIGEAPFGRPNLLGLGSILHWADANSFVWGTGFISAQAGLSAMPKRMLAVRGHLTRDRLHALGFPAPAVAGDPGVFVPEIFPASIAATDLGVVPHLVDVDEPFVRRARAAGAAILDVLSPIDSFLQRLSACRLIVSSSLHGLVFAHAYGIPAAWIKLSSRVHGDGFKFFDYYSSIGIAASDVRCFGPDADLSDVARACALPIAPIDTAALRSVLANAVPDLMDDEPRGAS